MSTSTATRPPSVSIVIVTRNGVDTLPDLLDALAAQRFEGGVEVVVVDSSSTDGTAALLDARGCRVISIPFESFDHGVARNRGIDAARGEFVVLIVQDAVPASPDWLAALVEPMNADPEVAGTYARQRPRPDASALTRHYAARWAASDVPRIVYVGGAQQLERLTPREQFDLCAFDDVCSCIRKSVWTQHRFEATRFAEDLEWAKTVLRHGFKIAYVPRAVVIHSHERSARYEFARTRALHRRLYHLFRMRTIPDTLSLARAIAASFALHIRVERSLRSLALAVAWPAGQFLGGRDGVRDATR